MNPLRKILITPYFGKFPQWMDKFQPPEGYDWLLDTNLDSFKKRVKDKLRIECPVEYGSSKVWDYRCALGLLYEEEIKEHDYWGHCDFDVVWGDMDKFYPDLIISQYDVISGHNTYVNGSFSLYRNNRMVNTLFQFGIEWLPNMIDKTSTGWVEKEFSRLLEQSGLKYAYTFYQGNPWDRTPIVKKESNSLYQLIGGLKGEWKEIAFFHFRHLKRWPLNIIWSTGTT